MKRKCPTCGRLREEYEFVSVICGWCDKIAVDAELELIVGGDGNELR